MQQKPCTSCGGPIVSTAATGRPPTYCSIACRRAAQARRARLGRHIEWLRRERVRLQLKMPSLARVSESDRLRLEMLDGELERTEGELFALLDDQEVEA